MPPRLEVFDPAMCCSTGACGPTTDPALARTAADLDWLRGRGVTVERHTLSQDPGAFVANAFVRAALEAGGVARLPVVLADGRVVSEGVYPDRAALATALGLGASSEQTHGRKVARNVEIELLALDLETCDRCVGTKESLEAALAKAADVARAEGVSLVVRTTLVRTVEQAETLGFVSSPTIRVNGRDIALETRASECGSCGDVAGEPIDCRVWVYEGREHTVAPEPMIVEAVLREVRRPSPAHPAQPCPVPDNIRRFLAASRRGATVPSPEAGTSCCAPRPTGQKPRVSKGRCC